MISHEHEVMLEAMSEGGGNYVMLDNRSPIAKKRYNCGQCGDVIFPGEKYHVEVGLLEGRFHFFRRCAHCQSRSE